MTILQVCATIPNVMKYNTNPAQPLAIYRDGQLTNKSAFMAYKASKIAHKGINRMREIASNARDLVAENRI